MDTGPDLPRHFHGLGCSQSTVLAEMSSDLISNGMESVKPEFSEDCLYLNIYTPADLIKRSKLPVMVWIHGGALLMEGASIYDGLVLSAHENVVVVTIQYCVGIWGFFSTGDEHSRGNQVAVLRWVQENIANFGGDPGSVTIFGQSAGGESVSVLVLSPLAKNLFHGPSQRVVLPSFLAWSRRTLRLKLSDLLPLLGAKPPPRLSLFTAWARRQRTSSWR